MGTGPGPPHGSVFLPFVGLGRGRDRCQHILVLWDTPSSSPLDAIPRLPLPHGAWLGATALALCVLRRQLGLEGFLEVGRWG